MDLQGFGGQLWVGGRRCGLLGRLAFVFVRVGAVEAAGRKQRRGKQGGDGADKLTQDGGARRYLPSLYFLRYFRGLTRRTGAGTVTFRVGSVAATGPSKKSSFYGRKWIEHTGNTGASGCV